VGVGDLQRPPPIGTKPSDLSISRYLLTRPKNFLCQKTWQPCASIRPSGWRSANKRTHGLIVKERGDLISATRYAIMTRRFARQTPSVERFKASRALRMGGVDSLLLTGHNLREQEPADRTILRSNCLTCLRTVAIIRMAAMVRA